MAKVLVSAYACEPGQGSEEGIGWGHVTQIARLHNIWVITRSNNRAAIDNELARRPMPTAHWIYFDLPHWARFWKKGVRLVRTYYYLWQLGAYLVALKVHRKEKFDLAHHVTFGMYWMPTFLPLLAIPFVWGPVGGGESIPRSFKHSFSARGRVYEALRNAARRLGEFDPFVRFAARRSAMALATSDETARRLRSIGCRSVLVRPSVALPAGELSELMSVPIRQCAPFRVVSTGRLLHWKGFELGLRAFATFHALFPNSEYWLIGDGPERRRLERLVRATGLTGSVKFWGALPRDRALAVLAECDVSLLPSLHESGGYASLEAMAAARAVICLDLGGPALQITGDTGIKIPAASPHCVIRDLTGALIRLASQPDVRMQLALAGRRRAQELFDWNEKGALLAKVYSQILDGSSSDSNAEPIRNTI